MILLLLALGAINYADKAVFGLVILIGGDVNVMAQREQSTEAPELHIFAIAVPLRCNTFGS
jgi:hypothetical protein